MPVPARCQLFSLDQASTLAHAVATQLGCEICPIEDRRFDDGEHKVRPLVDPGGAQVFVLASMVGDEADSPQDKLVRLLLFLSALKDHGAASVVAVIPYLAYARKDERTKPWDPISLRVVAQLVEAVGTDRVVAIEVHNSAAFDNAFRGLCTRVDGHRAFDGWVSEQVQAQARVSAGDLSWTVASPDPGGVKRALRWKEALEAQIQRPFGFAMVDKRRSAGLVSGGHCVAGDVRGCRVLLLDDLVASGHTAVLAARALRDAGAERVILAATHAVLTPQAAEHLATPAIDQILFTDTISPLRLHTSGTVVQKVTVVSVAALLAAAMCSSLKASSLSNAC